MNKEPLILKELVETCANLYGQSAVAKNIDIVVNIPTGITLTMDRNTSLIFIGNLINNAIKFTPEGGLLSINTSEEENFVRLHIVDTGIGMPPEVIKNLFKIDESISTQGTNNEKGTGLGLILCKEFVEKNGGDISVISEVGKGSEFIITLSKN
jgi:signal transduction histidine kinase